MEDQTKNGHSNSMKAQEIHSGVDDLAIMAFMQSEIVEDMTTIRGFCNGSIKCGESIALLAVFMAFSAI